MNLYQQVAAGNKVIKRLKDTLIALMKGKNDLVRKLMAVERLQNGMLQDLEEAIIHQVEIEGVAEKILHPFCDIIRKSYVCYRLDRVQY